jgi:hypothetical protein
MLSPYLVVRLKSYNCKPGDTINRSVSKRQKSMGIKIYYADGELEILLLE